MHRVTMLSVAWLVLSDQRRWGIFECDKCETLLAGGQLADGQKDVLGVSRSFAWASRSVAQWCGERQATGAHVLVRSRSGMLYPRASWPGCWDINAVRRYVQSPGPQRRAEPSSRQRPSLPPERCRLAFTAAACKPGVDVGHRFIYVRGPTYQRAVGPAQCHIYDPLITRAEPLIVLSRLPVRSGPVQ